MKNQMCKEQAERIVDAIIEDLSDRRGLGQEWEQINSDVQAEIRQRWMDLVMT